MIARIIKPEVCAISVPKPKADADSTVPGDFKNN